MPLTYSGDENDPQSDEEQFKGEQWFRFPYHLADKLWVFKSYGALAVYLVLLRHRSEDGRCYPGKALIGSKTGLSRETVRKALRHLEKIGLIHAKVRKNSSSLYYIKSVLPPLKKEHRILH